MRLVCALRVELAFFSSLLKVLRDGGDALVCALRAGGGSSERPPLGDRAVLTYPAGGIC